MRIALSSAPVKNKDIPHNLAAMTAALAQAAADGADLVVFGESTLQGFDCLCWSYAADRDMALPLDSAPIRQLQDAAQKYATAISFGFIERDGDALYSSCAFIGADGEITQEAKDQVDTLLHHTFRPEFLNRLDEIVFYKPLTKANITGIIDLQIESLNKRLADKQLRCELTDTAKQLIIDTSYDPQFGARPLRRYIQHTVETLIAKKILAGSILPGETITVDVENGELVIR